MHPAGGAHPEFWSLSALAKGRLGAWDRIRTSLSEIAAQNLFVSDNIRNFDAERMR
jgi:hypothetical protein